MSTEFELSNVFEEVIKKILLSLDTSKAARIEQISAKSRKDSVEVLALPLRNIINLFIKFSTFPEERKTAKLPPYLNNCARTDPEYYRPIFLLQPVSRIIEKSMHFQIDNYLRNN